ncbi:MULTISPECIES: pyrroline-5-carboxylate reductase [Fictibacillus]|uniref:Pyrroline-5-carboxylate reductase n=1 Tax=Fictibacillus enclensis TaxID=1017270 RepID=A0A0V8J8T3_9BACL|nr:MULTISPECIES: pyrroline-5-carboxylate reductase [Fictibacillus]KSU83316.1 pyrroline-5-carboxylate reductase [Fictibacillus enclensis]RXZ02062.1 pyrroline-5-carboxylate reductase [Fictibacillus sp. S7]SCC13454.1 pyrroline-5-carboxylate reductase [Fictibacillus enclensis]
MNTTFLFIGAGRMAESMIKGLQSAKGQNLSIIAANQGNKNRLQHLFSMYAIETTTDWLHHVKESSVIVLAMPPEAHEAVLEQLSTVIEGQLVISVAAGIGLKKLENPLPPGTPVAWVMPNTAAETGESISLYTYADTLNENQVKLLELLLKSIGKSEYCTEEQIHKLTAITGSAPAFLYEFASALINAAAGYGISEAQARKLVSQMIYGSAVMLQSGVSPVDLRNAVTTPGGSTAAGLEVLNQADFKMLIESAVKATNEKAAKLGGKQENEEK